ncbi:MAG: helix-turn-helix transcriptional regulator [Clostridium sp.]|nr:helix-turn-helix transcriptional regulator [Clostridium sp.]
MQDKTYFGELLKDIINFIGIKSSYLAKSLGYDVSYISKWCNGSKIPSSKNVEEVVNDLSEIFYMEILKKDCSSKFIERFIKQSKSSNLKEDIRVILIKAYNRSKKYGKEKLNINSNFIIGHTEIIDFISEKLKEIINTATEDLEILFTSDLLKIGANIYIENLEEYYNSEININVKVGCNSLKFKNNSSTYINSLNILLSKIGGWNISIYDNSEFSNLNLLIVKDKFLMMFSVDKKDEISCASFTSDLKVINTIYKQTICNFTNSNLLIKSIDRSEIINKSYIADFYNNSEFRFIYNSGFDFLLPQDILNKYIKDNKKYFKEYSVLLDMNSYIFKNAHLKVLIAKSKFINYIHTGRLMLKNISLVLSVDDIKLHLENIIEYIDNNSNIELFLLDDDSYNYDVDLSNLNFYSNLEKTFCLRIIDSSKENKLQVYKILDSDIIASLNNYYNNISIKKYCNKYSKDELLEMINYHFDLKKITEKLTKVD